MQLEKEEEVRRMTQRWVIPIDILFYPCEMSDDINGQGRVLLLFEFSIDDDLA